MKVTELSPEKAYLIRLEKDEEVMSSLVLFCKEKGIGHAWLNGLGAIKRARVGYYSLDTKEYYPQTYEDDMEVTGMVGNVALVDGDPFAHVHVTLSNTRNEAFGGHLFEAKVAVTLEIELRVYKEAVTRSMDDTIGLKLLDCGL